MTFPYTLWNPLSVAEVQYIFRNAPFAWGLAGGYAVEQFLGTPIRAHGDIDIVVFRDDQRQLYQWLNDWQLFAADPPGTLRLWAATEWLAFGIHDIWAYQSDAQAWQLQIMLLEADGDEWFSRRHPMIRGSRHDLLVNYHQVPCIRIEVQLLYKAKGNRAKDQLDFQACLPLLTTEARAWLRQALQLEHPDGHTWFAALSEQ
jgi:hypothetical protein